MPHEKQYKFSAELYAGRRGDVGVKFPYDVEKEFGRKGQVRVKVQIDGETYRGSLAPMGEGVHYIGVTKAIRNAIGKTVGDKVQVFLAKDTEPRTVEIPSDFLLELKKITGADKIFENFVFTHKKEYVRWIEEAKKEETRKRRINKAVEMISQGKKYS
jgi:hypothetical protein